MTRHLLILIAFIELTLLVAAIGLAIVRERENGVGVRMQDRGGRNERMQESFDRRARSARIEETARQIVDHILVRHLFLAVQQRCEVVEAHGRKLLRHDRLHVAAAALDEHRLDAIAEEVDYLHMQIGSRVLATQT